MRHMILDVYPDSAAIMMNETWVAVKGFSKRGWAAKYCTHLHIPERVDSKISSTCRKGHLLNEANTVIDHTGCVRCRICRDSYKPANAERARKRYQMDREGHRKRATDSVMSLSDSYVKHLLLGSEKGSERRRLLKHFCTPEMIEAERFRVRLIRLLKERKKEK